MTLQEIYDLIMDMKATTERIERNQTDEANRVHGQLQDHEDRIAELERKITERCPPPTPLNGADG